VTDARTAISNLIYTYAERIDAGDFDGLADLFAAAVVTAEGGIETRGRDAVLEMYRASTRRYEDDGTPKTKHVTTNLIMDIDEAAGTAACRSYFTVFQAVPGQLALQPVVAGRYRDTFLRAEGAWTFATRHMIVDLVGDLSRHLLIELPG
jgi:3-phenylpropionate/cinnamic acid dioxygenase small subunit